MVAAVLVLLGADLGGDDYLGVRESFANGAVMGGAGSSEIILMFAVEVGER